MGVETVVALGAAGALFGGATSYIQTQESNRAARRARQSVREAAGIQTTQLTEQAALERQKRINEAARIKARIINSGAASGFDTTSGDITGLVGQNTADTDLNLSILERNLQLEKQRVQSGAQANLDALKARIQSSVLAGITGGLGGAAAGLQLGMGINEVGKLSTPTQVADLPTTIS